MNVNIVAYFLLKIVNPIRNNYRLSIRLQDRNKIHSIRLNNRIFQIEASNHSAIYVLNQIKLLQVYFISFYDVLNFINE